MNTHRTNKNTSLVKFFHNILIVNNISESILNIIKQNGNMTLIGTSYSLHKMPIKSVIILAEHAQNQVTSGK